MLVKKKGKFSFSLKIENKCSTCPIRFLWVKLAYFRSQPTRARDNTWILTFSSKINFGRMNMRKRLLWPEICQFHSQKPYRTCRTLIFNFQRKREFSLFFSLAWHTYDARSEGASVHEKRQKKSAVFSSSWRFQSGWFSDLTIWQFDVCPSFFHKKWRFQKSSTPSFKRPLHEKTALFFCRKKEAPSDQASCTYFRKNVGGM